jgi:transglutaminase-like putative cysteine protease
VVDDSVVAIAGTPGAGPGLRLEIAGVAATPPQLDELPDQVIDASPAGGWEVRVVSSAWPTGRAWREVATQVHAVARRLTDDLAVSTFSAEDALAAGRGDCTTHAVLLAQELATRGYQARLVTGFVLDQGRLHRHRWVVVHIGKRWVPVDPMFDEVPAQPTHIALAVTGSSADELAYVDDVVYAPWRGAQASF